MITHYILNCAGRAIGIIDLPKRQHRLMIGSAWARSSDGSYHTPVCVREYKLSTAKRHKRSAHDGLSFVDKRRDDSGDDVYCWED